MRRAAGLFRFLALLAFGIAAGVPICAAQKATPGSEPTDMAADPALAERFFDIAVNQGTPAAELVDVVAPGFVFHLAADRYEGPDAFAAFVAELRSAFPDLQIVVQTAFAQGDRVAARFSLRGTHEGPYQGMAATHNPVLGVPGHAILRVADGRIAEGWVTVDAIELLRQLEATSGDMAAADPGPPSPPVGAAPDAGAVEAVRRFYEAYAAGDEAALTRLIAEDWVGHPVGAAAAPGRAGFAQNYAGWRAAFPDARQVVAEVVAAGDLVMVRVRVEGTHRGAFGDIAPTGRATAFDAIDLWRVRDGQLVELWSVGDYLGLVTQLEGMATPER